MERRVMADDATPELAEIRELTISHEGVAATLWDLSDSLARAAELHKKSRQRRGVVMALRGVTRYLHQLKFPREQIAPLDHILQALLDLEEGRRVPTLIAPDKKDNNARHGSTYWGLRGFLWAAIEIRCRIDGVEYPSAAATVADALPEAYNGLRRGRDPLTYSTKEEQSENLAKKLKEMYRTINEKEGGYPPTGNALPTIMDATRDMLNEAKRLTSPSAEKLLQEQYDRALEMAKFHLDRSR